MSRKHDTEVKLLAFDLLAVDGIDLRSDPLSEWKKRPRDRVPCRPSLAQESWTSKEFLDARNGSGTAGEESKANRNLRYDGADSTRRCVSVLWIGIAQAR